MDWGAPFKKAWNGATQAAKNAATAVSNYAGAAYQRTAQNMSPAQMAMHPQQALINFSAELARPPAEYAADAAAQGAVAVRDGVVSGYNTAKDGVVRGATAARDGIVSGYNTAKDGAVRGATAVRDGIVDGATAAKDAVVDGAKALGAEAAERADAFWGNTVVPAREQQIRDAYGVAHENLSDCPAGSPVNGCPGKQVQCQRLKKARDDAILSEHAYMDQNDVEIDPERYARTQEMLASTGYQALDVNADADKLMALGLDDPQGLLEPPNTSFRARVYQRGDDYVVAYRGTQTGADWLTNVKNGSGLESLHYTQSADIARALKSGGSSNVSFTGHSLAGGLASHSAYLSGFPATTHNAAGLNMNILQDANPAGAGPVDAYFNAADPLNALQDNRGKVLAGTTLAATPWPMLQGAVAGWLAGNEVKGTPVMPQAYGTRRPLPLPTDNKNPGILEGHSMPLLIEGIEIQMDQLGC